MTKKILKKITAIMLILMISSFVLMPYNVSAAIEPVTLGDLEDLLNDLKRQKQENDNNKQYTEQQIKDRNAAIGKSEAEKTAAEEEKEQAEEKIEESNIKIAELTIESENLLRYLQQMQGENAYIEYVTGSTSVTDFIMRLAAVEQINEYNKQSLDKLDQTIKENKQLKIELQEKQVALDAQIVKYRKTIEGLVGNLETYDKYAPGLADQVKNAQTTYTDTKKLCSENPNTAGLGRNAIISKCSNVPYNAGWLKPLKSGRISSRISIRDNPATGAIGEYHNGLDIAGNPEGTPIYASAAGTVGATIPRYSCGGNMLFINVKVGGVEYTTFYYHLLKFNVKVGDVVNQNTVIGYVGGGSTATRNGGYDNCTTGAHLHFGVQKGYTYTGSINRYKVIVPPGFPNQEGYRFYSRTDFWG